MVTLATMIVIPFIIYAIEWLAFCWRGPGWPEGVDDESKALSTYFWEAVHRPFWTRGQLAVSWAGNIVVTVYSFLILIILTLYIGALPGPTQRWLRTGPSAAAAAAAVAPQACRPPARLRCSRCPCVPRPLLPRVCTCAAAAEERASSGTQTTPLACRPPALSPNACAAAAATCLQATPPATSPPRCSTPRSPASTRCQGKVSALGRAMLRRCRSAAWRRRATPGALLGAPARPPRTQLICPPPHPLPPIYTHRLAPPTIAAPQEHQGG